jgi:hypothetical protein
MTTDRNTTVLSSCGCDEEEAHDSTENGPGLDALTWRTGTWATFRARMLAQLAKQALPDGEYAGERPLLGLATRSSDDPTVALVDAWATAAHVLSFYQERIANESFLRTAVERRSVLELARSIGYELDPGVAASAWLAFTVVDAEGSPSEVDVPTGTQVMSLPPPGQLPQKFETIEDIVAGVAWNAMAPRQTKPVDLDEALEAGLSSLRLQGIALNLKVGDRLLFIGDDDDQWEFADLVSVDEDLEANVTTVTFDEVTFPEGTAEDVVAYVFRVVAPVFGHNAPEWKAMSQEWRDNYDGSAGSPDWPGFEEPWFQGIIESGVVGISRWCLELDGEHREITGGRLLVDATLDLHEIQGVRHKQTTNFTLSGKVTRLGCETFVVIPPNPPNEPDQFDRRQGLIYAGTEALVLAEEPLTEALSGDVILLDSVVDGLTAGRTLLVEGTDTDGEALVEAVEIHSVGTDDGLTAITLTTSLTGTYDRTTVTIYGNVAAATHGETVSAVLGSGDASVGNAEISILDTPLTHVSADTPSGAASTLQLRVDGVLWEEVATLYDQGPRDEVYTLRLADDGTPTVGFGDGVRGARLPTGESNVVGTWRKGLGIAGNVDARTLMLLANAPAGIQSVTNPIAASGGADPEVIDDARENAPLTTLTFGRLVSLRDYADFSRAFAGIGKAHADEVLWAGRRIAYVSVLDAEGNAVADGSAVHSSLSSSLRRYGDVEVQVVVGSAEPGGFEITASVLVDDRYDAESVLAEVRAALEAAWSWEARSFVQMVTAAEIVEVMHGVEGVVAVDIDSLTRTDIVTLDLWMGPIGKTNAVPLFDRTGLSSVLTAKPARVEDGALVPAEILVLETLTLTERSA